MWIFTILFLLAITHAPACIVTDSAARNSGRNSDVSGSPSVSPTTLKNTSQTVLLNRENSIYSALLAELGEGKFGVHKRPRGVLLILKMTSYEPDLNRKAAVDFDASLWGNFISKNAQSVELPRSFDLYFDYVVLDLKSETDFRDLIAEKYPAAPGLLSLSRIGFNDDFNQALIFVTLKKINGDITKSFWLISFKDGQILSIREIAVE